MSKSPRKTASTRWALSAAESGGQGTRSARDLEIAGCSPAAQLVDIPERDGRPMPTRPHFSQSSREISSRRNASTARWRLARAAETPVSRSDRTDRRGAGRRTGDLPVVAEPIVPLGRPRAGGHPVAPEDRDERTRPRRRGTCPGQAAGRGVPVFSRHAAAAPAPRRLTPELGRPAPEAAPLGPAGDHPQRPPQPRPTGRARCRTRRRTGSPRRQRGLGRRAARGPGSRSPTAAGSAAAAASPARAWTRPAARSSSSATSSSGPVAAAARCQTRRSGSIRASVAAARARWTSRRSCGDPAA